jgi:hypothetical protein
MRRTGAPAERPTDEVRKMFERLAEMPRPTLPTQAELEAIKDAAMKMAAGVHITPEAQALLQDFLAGKKTEQTGTGEVAADPHATSSAAQARANRLGFETT